MTESKHEQSLKFYAFISYKHSRSDSGKFKNDGAWATALDNELRKLNIPTTIDDTELIKVDDDTVHPVFRDVSSLNTVRKGQLPKKLIERLRESKTLVLIVSKEMIREQNEKHSKGEAWIYWEVETFLKLHGHNWNKIIPVYVDKDDYSPEKIKSKIGFERKFENIEKPYQDYKDEYDWDSEIDLFYQKTAAAVASDIFHVSKDTFWNTKEKARQAQEAERKKAIAQKRFWIMAAAAVAILAISATLLALTSKSNIFLSQAKAALQAGNRGKAITLSEKSYHYWPRTKGVAEARWAAKDSTIAYMTVNSAVCFDKKDSIFAYIDKSRFVVIVDAKSFKEIDRIDVGNATYINMSPNGRTIAVKAGTGDTRHRFYDRVSRQWWENKSYGYYSSNGNRPYMFSEDGQWFFFGGALVGPSSTIYTRTGLDDAPNWDVTDASFMSSDTLLAVVRKHNSGRFRLEVFPHFDVPDRYGNISPFVIELPNGTAGARLVPTSNQIISFTADSIHRHHLARNDDGYYLIHELSQKTSVALTDVRYCGNPRELLALDSLGNGYEYDMKYQSSNADITAFSWTNQFKKEFGDDVVVPILVSDPAYIMHYFGDKEGVNLTDKFESGYIIPVIKEGTNLSGSIHKGITCVTATDDKGNNRSFIYSRGDRRFIKIMRWLYAECLSGHYMVNGGLDIFKHEDEGGKSWTTTMSLCLFDIRTGEHLMHLSFPEDKDIEYAEPRQSVLNGDYLSVHFSLPDSKSTIRLYDISKCTMIKEVRLNGKPGPIKRANGCFIYSSGGELFKVSVNNDDDPECLSSNYAGIFSVNDPDNLDFTMKSADGTEERFRYCESDGQLHESHENQSPKGTYFFKMANNWSTSNGRDCWIVNGIALDTLCTFKAGHGVHHPIFSPDETKLLYATGDSIICRNIPSGTIRWEIPMWEPTQTLISKNYLVVKSSSLYVIRLSDGKTVCQFEDVPEAKPLISPNEMYLLCGQNLYSLRKKELLSSTINTDYKDLEDDCIVYKYRIMMLPD